MTPYRIGHLVGELSLWHLEYKDLQKNFFYIWYIPKKNCNNFFIKKISKKINISSFFLLKILHDLFLKFNQKDFLISGPTHGERDINCLISRNQNIINFSQEEVKRGDELLEKLGINKTDHFVCLCIRDNFFFKNFVPNYAWEEAQFKNSNIENYSRAVEYLNSKKVKVIRMGHGSEKNWGSENDLNIDYSRNKLRSGFLDFYLVHKSKFVIMNGTGFYWIPYILKKPILMADFIPIGNICTYIPNSIYLFKHIYSKKDKRNLDLESLLSADKSFIYRNTEFKKKKSKGNR
jgi:putative glycosyltransferase (TIGR04372 family)